MKKILSIFICIYILTLNTFCFADGIGGEIYRYQINSQVEPFVIFLLFLLVFVIVGISWFQLKKIKEKNKSNEEGNENEKK